MAWINYLRVPAALSGLLLLVWFPLILRLRTRYHASTTLSASPFLWHWLAVTGVLFLAVGRRAGAAGPRPAATRRPARSRARTARTARAAALTSGVCGEVVPEGEQVTGAMRDLPRNG